MVNSPVIASLLDENTQQALNLSKKIKIRRLIGEFQPSEDDLSIIKNTVRIHELAIVTLWKFALDKSSDNLEQRNELRELCKNCFDLLGILPIPKTTIQKMRHVLKLITYSYLGDKWEDMKRILLNNSEIWELDYDSNDWDMELFATIYTAILHLIRKEKLEDLNEIFKLIEKLRSEQKKYEKAYLIRGSGQFQKSAAYELASLYHLAKSVEVIGQYMIDGTPKQPNVVLDIHFDSSINYCRKSGQMELELILRMLQLTFRKMVENSIWAVANRVNSKVKQFTKLMTESTKPVFELMYPQRVTVLEKGLLDPANRAIVVTLPTSGGKTMIAQFRMLQALNQFSDQDNAWIAYIVPTRALVNQIASRLRRDLGKPPLNIRVEKMSGALEPDAFEQSLFSSKNDFDVLVVTPEKLNMIIRQGIENKLNDSLVLAVVDEAHNLGDGKRGLNLEMLISIIKNDCKNSGLLLLTPSLTNANQVAEWLDPENPKSITMELDWKPNDSVVGLLYHAGRRRDIKTHFSPILYSSNEIEESDEITIEHDASCIYASSDLNTKYKLASLVSRKLVERGNMLVLASTVSNTWKTAETVADLLPTPKKPDERIELVKKFVAAEMGDAFPLLGYLDKRIGVHNAGLPDEVRQLMEWLMENGSLKILISTTTIAQGMNFPVSSILLSSYSYREGIMPAVDFWNLAGRAGRSDQRSIGLVGIIVDGRYTPDALDAIKFTQRKVGDVVSILAQLFREVATRDKIPDLQTLASEPRWSNFLQYLAHMYNQSNNLGNFMSMTEITLRNTYGYHQLESWQKSHLLES